MHIWFNSYVNAQPVRVEADLDDDQVLMLVQYALLRLIEIGAIEPSDTDGGISVDVIDPTKFN